MKIANVLFFHALQGKARGKHGQKTIGVSSAPMTTAQIAKVMEFAERLVPRCGLDRSDRRVVVGLGEIHGDIGAPDQIIFITAIAWVDGNADTCRYRNRMVVDDIRPGQMRIEFLCHLRSTSLTLLNPSRSSNSSDLLPFPAVV